MKNNVLKVLQSSRSKLSSAWLITLFSCLLSGVAWAQSPVVEGKVTAADDGSAMPGVSVLVKGTSNGTSTDVNGTFRLTAPSEDAVLIFSFIGFATQEIRVGNQTILNVTLKLDTKQLAEVVVTALGISKDKRTIGYAIQEVKGEELIKAREPNPINSLVGKVAGLTVGASAELLRKPNIQLRGNSDLLFVVDGVPINSDTWNVSPDDIETYTVLKGPAASALYGFRGKNGAILITTKKGSRDRRGFSVEVNSSTMFDEGFLAIPKVQDEYGPGDHGVYEFVDGRGGGKNDGDYDVWGPKLDGRLLPQYDSPIDPTTGKRIPTPWTARGKDNLERFLQTGILSTNNIAVASSTDKYDMRFSVSHAHQRGIVPNTKLNITNFNASLGYNFSKRLRFESNVNYNRQYTPNFPDVNYGPNSLIYNTVIWAGADWDVDEMKNYWQPGREGVQQIYAEYQRYNNPHFVAHEWLRGHYKTDVYGYASLKYKLTDFMEVTGRTQVTSWDLFRPEKFPYSAGTYGRDERAGDYREDRRNLSENNTDLLLKVDKNVHPDFNVKAWVGGNLRTFTYNSSFTTTDYLLIPGLYNFSNSRNPYKNFNYNSKMQVGSAYYSMDLSYRNFLTLSTTGRLDKLSTLPKKNNTYFYPSVSVSTSISDYIKLPTVISFLKVRGSYANVKSGFTRSTIGTTPAISAYPLEYGQQYYSSYDGPSYENALVYDIRKVYGNQSATYFSNTLNNPGIKPEASSVTEVGLDLQFLQNRLGLDVTYFVSNEGPKIFNLTIPESSGYTGATVNGIKTQKKGLEISLQGAPIKNPGGFSWTVLANWSTFRERLKEIYPSDPSIDRIPSSFFVAGSASNRYIRVGDRVDAYYNSAFAKSPDGQIIHDASGKPIRTPVPQFLGYTDPDWVWGINNRFSYRAITFSFQFDGRVGGSIENQIQRQTFRGGRHIETVQGAMGEARAKDTEGIKSYVGQGVTVSSGAINYNTEGSITNYNELKFTPNTTPQYLQDYISYYYSTQDANMMSRSFAKLREVIIGYTVPQTWLGKTFIRQAAISFVGRNLIYISAKKDMDIDQFATRQGSADLQTPTTRRYGVNLNLTF